MNERGSANWGPGVSPGLGDLLPAGSGFERGIGMKRDTAARALSLPRPARSTTRISDLRAVTDVPFPRDSVSHHVAARHAVRCRESAGIFASRRLVVSFQIRPHVPEAP